MTTGGFLSELRPLAVAFQNHDAFPSATSGAWFFRMNKKQLIEMEAVVFLNGQWLATEKMPEAIREIGRRVAVKKAGL